MAPTQETRRVSRRFFFRGAHISGALRRRGKGTHFGCAGLVTNRAGNSLRLLTGQVPENRVLWSCSRFEFSGNFRGDWETRDRVPAFAGGRHA